MEEEEFVDGLKITITKREPDTNPGTYKYCIQLASKYNVWEGIKYYK